jgi:hypothetical protein
VWTESLPLVVKTIKRLITKKDITKKVISQNEITFKNKLNIYALVVSSIFWRCGNSAINSRFILKSYLILLNYPSLLFQNVSHSPVTLVPSTRSPFNIEISTAIFFMSGSPMRLGKYARVHDLIDYSETFRGKILKSRSPFWIKSCPHYFIHPVKGNYLSQDKSLATDLKYK